MYWIIRCLGEMVVHTQSELLRSQTPVQGPLLIHGGAERVVGDFGDHGEEISSAKRDKSHLHLQVLVRIAIRNRIRTKAK